ncbi:MAG TPA: hypothetical protein VF761_16725 [Gemmatimonadaceae bacterium]
MQRFHVRSGWAHFRATMAEPFSGRRSSTQFFEPLCIDDPNAGGGGGGGGGGNDGGGNNGGDGGAGGAGGGNADDEAAKKAAEDRKLAAEAAGWRTKYRDEQKKFGDFQTSATAQIDALKAELEEMKSRGNGNGNGNPQPGANGQPAIETHPEFVKMQRQLTEVTKSLTAERETLAKERATLKNEKIQRAVGEVAGEGKFLLPTIFRKVLAEKVDIAADGALVMRVPNEVGGTDEVPFTLDNVLKYRPIDEFDSFLPSNGSNGSGNNGGGSGKGRQNDGIDWAKVEGPGMDLDYIQKNAQKIAAARLARQQ